MRLSIDKKGSDGFGTPTLFVIRRGLCGVSLAAAGPQDLSPCKLEEM